MFATKALRQASAAAAHAERIPLIKFLGKRTTPSMSLNPNNLLFVLYN
jgi:small subunit ribosomal protein YMR-31